MPADLPWKGGGISSLPFREVFFALASSPREKSEKKIQAGFAGMVFCSNRRRQTWRSSYNAGLEAGKLQKREKH